MSDHTYIAGDKLRVGDVMYTALRKWQTVEEIDADYDEDGYRIVWVEGRPYPFLVDLADTVTVRR